GRHLVVGFTAGIPKLPLNLTLLKSCQIVGVFWGEFTARYPALHAANVAALMALYLDGRIKPAVTERFPLVRGGEALARFNNTAPLVAGGCWTFDFPADRCNEATQRRWPLGTRPPAQ